MGKGKKKSRGKSKPKDSKRVGKRDKKEAGKQSKPQEKQRPEVPEKKAEKAGETLDELKRKKDEINALLSSLEDAYNEATILEDDYNDIKARNEKKLKEIEGKIDSLESKGSETGEPEPAETPAPSQPAEAEAPSYSKYGAPPPPPPDSASAPETTPSPGPAASQPAPAEEPPPLPQGTQAPSPPLAPEPKAEAAEQKTGKREELSKEDLRKLENEIAGKVKDMVEEIGAKVSQKDLLEMKNNFTKYETEMEKMKAKVEAASEAKNLLDEKIQRLVEGMAEIRTTVNEREASLKERDVKFEKIMDVMDRLKPESLIVELQKRDRKMEDQKMRIDKLEETTNEMTQMLRRIEKILKDIGSLENVIKVSNEASETLMNMQNMERNNQKTLDKVQGIYAELSKRMEDFMLYRAKQDRMEDLINDALKNMDEVNTKMASLVTRDDLESLQGNMMSSVDSKIESAVAAIPAAPSGRTESPAGAAAESEKEEIEDLLKSLEEEVKSGTISKEEYEQMKKANLEKLEKLEKKTEEKPSPAPAPEPAGKDPDESGKEDKESGGKEGKKPDKEEKGKEEKEEDEKKEKSPERKENEENLLKDLEETFKKGFISKKAYEKTKKMILGKGE